MSVIAMFSATFCDAETVAEKVSEKLGYPLRTERDLIEKASEAFGTPREDFERLLHGRSSVLDKFKHKKEHGLACLKSALAEMIRPNNLVYHGYGTHMIPSEITHVLKVGVVANRDHRIKAAMERDGLSEKEAQKAVHRDDAERYQWVQTILDKEPWDELLYDLMAPTHGKSVEEVAKLICENAQKAALATTSDSRDAMDDFVLAARVGVALAEQGYFHEVQCEHGEVTIVVNEYVMRLNKLSQELNAIAEAVPGVESVRTRVGPKYRTPAIYGEYEFDMPKKVLLVDDEREFVETLSERLTARDFPSKVAYSGEEALTRVESEEPDVMVLDLKMPGIDGMEVLRRVKRERPNVEVIILTGHGSEADRQLAEELGAFAYLEKPVDIEVLTKTMAMAYRRISEKKSAPGEV
jgi:CheY-like chemotaxis protein